MLTTTLIVSVVALGMSVTTLVLELRGRRADERG